ncbi:MAG: hypothetical protein PHD25_12285, partial [Bacteroidales bacterium]|nr:hypothetical protein [Bacteroidales bacterium]
KFFGQRSVLFLCNPEEEIRESGPCQSSMRVRETRDLLVRISVVFRPPLLPHQPTTAPPCVIQTAPQPRRHHADNRLSRTITG